MKTDAEQIEEAVEEAIDDNPEAVQNYKDGKDGSMYYLVGAASRKVDCSFNPVRIKEAIKDKIDGSR